MVQTSHVVIMGDLVNSEAAASTHDLHLAFNSAVAEANRAFADQIDSPLTITLGDEFQGICRRFEIGIAIMRRIRWLLLDQNIQCRFVVGKISLATPLNAERAWNMMGPGLSEAREKLAQKRDPNVYRFSLPDAPVIEVLLEGLGLALTDLEAGWTARQRDIALAPFRFTDSRTTLMKRFKVTDSVFYKIRRAAKFDLYVNLWSAISAAATSFDAEAPPR